MKRFSFKLDSVLKYREHQERKARIDLSDARNAWLKARNAVDGLEEERETLVAQLRRDAVEGVEASWYMTCQNYVARLEDELKLARNKLEKQNRIVEVKRKTLKEQYMKKESLGALKSLHAQAHQKQVEFEEQKYLDEMILIKKGGAR